ncbi:DNA repair protein RecO [Neptunicoccus cionae]|uniref:DNA repair protein RecO n=1 Tax=Neptunicoccus cionae TaxID=2035344 RepID=A0A916QQ81_9RHOB|nr:DNA repair protein RecO [Amylibacter cionae]GGA05875.1 DNA repair protein RecO [Amylibacter cionae]
MEWRDEGVILSARRHGESSVILEVLTKTHGRHAGVVRGGASRKLAPVLQPGNQVEVEWRARLEEHLGGFHVELLRSRSAIMGDRAALAALGAICALGGFALPERMELPEIYTRTIDLVDALEAGEGWQADYAIWELMLLEELGYGLDLGSCAATGTTQELVYVSPKSGRAVCRSSGLAYADRMLPLPVFLQLEGAEPEAADILAALKTTGYFLERWLAPALGNRPLPEARGRLVQLLTRRVKKDAQGDSAAG